MGGNEKKTYMQTFTLVILLLQNDVFKAALQDNVIIDALARNGIEAYRCLW